jgi:crotonobetainyl-CoA:carnitine CoA-transferase CaiB-like acyl-CoA transferase
MIADLPSPAGAVQGQQGSRPLRVMAHPVTYDGERPPVVRPPPALGEHTREVLREVLGLESSEIDRLEKHTDAFGALR